MSFQDEAILLLMCPLVSLRPRQVLLEYSPRPRLATEHIGSEAKHHLQSSLE
jgi:hypothetical protein